MATSSITANFEIGAPKAYLPNEASFAKQSGYISARAFVDGLWKTYRMKPPRRPKNVQCVSVTAPDVIRALVKNWKAARA